MMPVIAWNALHASTILREAMKALRSGHDRRHRRRRGARARAARPQHRDRDGAQPVHRLRRDGRDRQGVGDDRPTDPRAGARARAAGRAAQLERHPVGRCDDARDRRGRRGAEAGAGGTGKDGEESRWRVLAFALVRPSCLPPPPLPALPPLPAQPPPENRKAGLFPPLDLGLLEAPDREQWQKPDQIMDALKIADGSVVADLGAGGGWFTIRLARRVGPNGLVYAEDIQPLMIEAIKRRVQRENLTNVRTVLGTTNDPRLPRGLDAVLIVGAYHEMEDPVTLLKNAARRSSRRAASASSTSCRAPAAPGRSPISASIPEAVIRARGRGRLQVISRETDPAVPVSCWSSAKDRAPAAERTRRPVCAMRVADHCRQRLERRRRHSGRPQDVRGARRLRHERDHRDHGAEHGRRHGGRRCRPIS